MRRVGGTDAKHKAEDLAEKGKQKLADAGQGAKQVDGGPLCIPYSGVLPLIGGAAG